VPFDDYPLEFAVGRSDSGTILKTSSFGSPGEPVRRVRDRNGRIVEVWIGGIRLMAPRAVNAEMKSRYGVPRRALRR
jgi:D-alanyl-D-alanine carboxypeptidase